MNNQQSTPGDWLTDIIAFIVLGIGFFCGLKIASVIIEAFGK